MNFTEQNLSVRLSDSSKITHEGKEFDIIIVNGQNVIGKATFHHKFKISSIDNNERLYWILTDNADDAEKFSNQLRYHKGELL